MDELRPCPCDDPEDDVQEVSAAEAIATQVPTRVRKARIRIPWSEGRLLYGLKVKTMRLIQESLARDRTLWPCVPIAETLDQWLDEAVKRHVERRGRKATKASNTGEGDDPLKDEVAAIYTLPELEDASSIFEPASRPACGPQSSMIRPFGATTL